MWVVKKYIKFGQNKLFPIMRTIIIPILSFCSQLENILNNYMYIMLFISQIVFWRQSYFDRWGNWNTKILNALSQITIL